MASSFQPTRRFSYDQLQAVHDDDDDDGRGSMYACDCGQEFSNEQNLRRHQQNDCQNRPVTCSFCQEIYPSSAKLREHLLLCGNKTDQCPNCLQLIRRSHFAYHYENNCAPIDRVETPPPPPRPKNRSALHPVTNSNKPYSREDIPSDDYPQRENGRIQTPKSTPRSSPGIIECEFCHNRCAQNDYRTHRDNCLRNPANINHKPQLTRVILGSNQSQNQNNSNGIVHIPCEICSEPIDLPNWSKHIQNCRERERQRIAMRARSMSQEPVTEKLPCEHCQQSYSAKQLQAHQIKCPNNPENVDPRNRLIRVQPSKSASLPTRRNNRSHPTSNDGRSRKNIQEVQYQRIDVDRTREANRSFDSDRSTNLRNANHDIVSRSNELISPNRSRPPNGTLPRERSSFDNLRNIGDTQNPNGRAAGNRSPYSNNPSSSPRFRQGRQTLEVINNQPDRPSIKKHEKKSFWRSFFCGAPTPVFDD